MGVHMMTPHEIKVARRVIGLRGTSLYAKGNSYMGNRDIATLDALASHQYAEQHAGEWKLTPRGLDQLRLQIGEFMFRKKKLL